MAINPIEASVGLEMVHSKSLQSNVRLTRPPATPPEPVPAAVSGEAERFKGEQRKAFEQEQQKIQLPNDQTLRFRVDKDSGKTVAEILDTAGEILRQMPTEEALELAKSLEKLQQGLIVNLKV